MSCSENEWRVQPDLPIRSSTLMARNQSGQSLVQVLVAVGLMGMMIMVITSAQVNQRRETQALSEKMASLELQRTVTLLLNNPMECSKLVDPANLTVANSTTFDASSISPNNPYILRLNAVSPNPGSPRADGNPVSPLTNSLVLQKATPTSSGVEIVVTSISPPIAKLNLRFDQTRLVRPVKEPQLDLSLNMTGPANATVIGGCRGGGGAPGSGDWTCEFAGSQPSCLNLSTGQHCYDGQYTTGWQCPHVPSGWPGAGNWQCKYEVPPTGGSWAWICINVSDGQTCYTNNTTAGVFHCRSEPGWPGGA